MALPKPRPRHPFAGGRKAKPTQKHRLAIWENMLGTVYASNGTETRYFDYDWDGAREFAGVNPDDKAQDLRIAKARYAVSCNGQNLRKGQAALYVRR